MEDFRDMRKWQESEVRCIIHFPGNKNILRDEVFSAVIKGGACGYGNHTNQLQVVSNDYMPTITTIPRFTLIVEQICN